MPIGVPLDMFDGAIFATNKCGDIEIINYSSARKVKVRFVDTGLERYASVGHIRDGRVKDRTRPSIYGVGFLGVGDYGSKSHPDAYSRWMDMLRRCYSKEDLKIFETYSDCSVCDDWHNFQVFAEWYYLNLPDDGNRYDVDKDIRSEWVKTYSPETCIFVSHNENMVKAHARSYKARDPSGRVVEFYNMRQFCRDNNLESGSMSRLLSGKVNNYRGWTRSIEIEVEVTE